MSVEESQGIDTKGLLAQVMQLRARVSELEQGLSGALAQREPPAVVPANTPGKTLTTNTYEALGRAVQLCSNDGFWHWDLRRGIVSAVRPSPMLGFTEQLDPHRNPVAALHPEDQADVLKRMAPALVPGGNDFNEGVYRLQHRLGHYIPVLVRARILRDADGKAVEVFGTNVDISVQIAQEQALKAALAQTEQQQQLLRLTVDSIGQGLLVCDAESRVILFNTRLCDLLNIDSDFLARRPRLRELVEFQLGRGDFGENAALLPPGPRAYALGQSTHIDPAVSVHYTRKTLDGRFIELQSYPSANGTCVRTFTDITALKQALDSAEAAARAKERFLASMSHELRTPLTAVLGLNQLLMASPLSADQHDLACRVGKAGDFLLSLVNDILDFSKSQAGHQVARPEEIDLHGLMGEVHSLLIGLAQAKQLDLQVALDPAVPRHVIVDPLRLKQVLVNLGSNAIKFTAKGHVRIQVDARLVVQGDLLLRFEVSDTGIGIAASDQIRVFEPFSQVEDSAARRAAGTGLGLSISRQWVSLLRGDLQLSSTPGVGSCFWFEIPAGGAAPRPAEAGSPTAAEGAAATNETLARQDQRPISGTVAGAASRPRRLQGLRLLAVDDNATNRMLVELFLTREGCSVDLCDSAHAALERLRLTPAAWDVVLMDMQMPLMDGLAATRQIRSVLSLQHLPVFGMTANILESDRQACLDAGMNGHVAKPFNVDSMVATLAPWVARGAV